MSLPRLNYIVILLLIASTSHAQQDRSMFANSIDTSLVDLKQKQNLINKYTQRKDSIVNASDSASFFDIKKINPATGENVAEINNITETVANLTSTGIAKTGNSVQNYTQKTDSAITSIETIPTKYFKQVNKKIDKYSNRVTSKTKKTLTKLSRWENKIKKLLDKASPETSARLFGKNQLTFSGMLIKLKQGENFMSSSEAQYDKYRDKLNTNIKYIQSQKDKLNSDIIKPATKTAGKINELDQDIANSEEISKIIRERKKQLINESIKYIGKSKYLAKINKESYYYVETLRNYKNIFSDPKKAEQTAMDILNKIPAFQKFTKENSALASLFGGSSNYGNANVSGLQTRASINGLIQEKIAIGGPNVKQMINEQMQAAQGELNKLKDKISKNGSGNADEDMPSFKPNKQKTKTFAQRLEYACNFQFGKSTGYMPSTADIGLSIGYKLNDKSIIGLGAAYKMGMGTIEKIQFSNQGIDLRSFLEWKLKKQFFISGGYEMNHNSSFKNIAQLKGYDSWQQSVLLGITKKIKLKTKFYKGTSIQLMYDFLCNKHIPVSQPFVFRTGYTF
ncbi:MAG: hypothetical protein QM737_15975 [Ferruginibacter sp.]